MTSNYLHNFQQKEIEMTKHKKNCGAVILAAGKGTRMHSPLPKVLHELLGEPMLKLVTSALYPLFENNIWTIVGHKAELVKEQMDGQPVSFVLQSEQLGTGHAFKCACPSMAEAKLDYALIANGDVPLLETGTMQSFMDKSLEENADIAFLTLTLEDPAAFGRVLRKNGKVSAIIEAKDYSPALHGPEPKEINAGIYFINLKKIVPLLDKIGNTNKSGEYYITDLIGLSVAENLNVLGVNLDSDPSLLGVNNTMELVEAEEELRRRLVKKWQQSGVIIRNPDAVRIGPKVILEAGAEITGPCELYGTTHISASTRIESHCWINDTSIAEGCHVRSFCHFDSAKVASRCTLGPYARLRPGAELLEEAHIGNFVEMKKATLGEGAKANHLSYLGDTEVGPGANIGAGTITCNYDGVNKHKTVIGPSAFIGSNTALVAPVTIGEKALVAAGSVITKDVPENTLGVGRARQVNLPRREKTQQKK